MDAGGFGSLAARFTDRPVVTYDPRGADLSISGKAFGRVEGVARLVTDRHGNPTSLVGIATTPARSGSARQNAVPSSQPRLERPLTCQRPLMPGVTTRRRRSFEL